MTDIGPLPDHLIEAMLERRAVRVRPIGLLQEIHDAVGRTPQSRRALLDWPDRRPSLDLPVRLVWLAAAIGLLLAALVGLTLIGARLAERTPTSLRYVSGLDTVTSTGNQFWSATTDIDGNVWAWNPGRLVRFAASTGSIRSWDISDDEAFASVGIARSRSAGVWVIGREALRRFDGEGFRDRIDGPGFVDGGDIRALAEAPDGGVWAALGALGPRRWNGSAWVTVGDSPPALFTTFITVDAAGRVWAGGTGGGVSVYDGSGWTTYPSSADAPASRSDVRFIAVAPDGAVWVATDGGVARLEGTAWTDLTPDIVSATGAPPAGVGVISIAFGSDGTPWVAFLSGGELGVVHVASFDGNAWTGSGPLDGLPIGSYAAAVATSGTEVYLVASPGVYRLNGRAWEPVWSTAAQPVDVRHLLGISRDEAWAATEGGLYRFHDGSWVRDDPARAVEEQMGTTLARAPDGTIWAAGGFGVAVRGADRWEVFSDIRNGGPVAIGPDGTAWVVDSRYPADELEVSALAHTAGAWTRRSVGTSPLGWISSLAVGPDGTVWAGSDGFFAGERSGLARFDGSAWERVRPLGTSDVPIKHIDVAANGDVWVGLDYGRAARFDGRTWAIFGESDELPTLSQAFGVGPVAGPDGTVWVPTIDGLARFDGQQWAVSHCGMEFSGLSVAPDGTVWVIGPSGVERLRTVDAAD